MSNFNAGDRVRTGRRVTHCDAYPYAVYVILAGPFENAYDDGSAKWSEYVGAFAEDGFRNTDRATLHTIDANSVHRVCAHDEIEAHDTGLYEPGKPAHHGFQSIWCDGPPPDVPMVAMDVDDLKALALLNDGFDRGQLVCDSFAATKSEQDDFARAMIRLERIVRARGEVKP